jgi:hypothetical protein
VLDSIAEEVFKKYPTGFRAASACKREREPETIWAEAYIFDWFCLAGMLKSGKFLITTRSFLSGLLWQGPVGTEICVWGAADFRAALEWFKE